MADDGKAIAMCPLPDLLKRPASQPVVHKTHNEALSVSKLRRSQVGNHKPGKGYFMWNRSQITNERRSRQHHKVAQLFKGKERERVGDVLKLNEEPLKAKVSH